MNTIRASMLPAYPDCGRRVAARQFPRLIAAAGFTLRALLPSVGAAVGTSAHKAVAAIQGRRKAGEDADADAIRDSLSGALATFREEIAPGAEWDDTTPNLQVAEFQIQRMTEASLSWALTVQPAEVELPLRAQLAPDWELTGTIDLLTTDAHLDDLKTGALRRPYQAQLGGYSLLAKSNGYDVRSAGTTFVQRSKKTKPQAPAERQPYDLPTAERAAFSTAHAIIRDVDAFTRTGDPFQFGTNPMSLLCSHRYCPAHSTPFCTMHMPARAVSVDVD